MSESLSAIIRENLRLKLFAGFAFWREILLAKASKDPPKPWRSGNLCWSRSVEYYNGKNLFVSSQWRVQLTRWLDGQAFEIQAHKGEAHIF